MTAARALPVPGAAVARGIGFGVLAYAAFATADAIIKLSSAGYAVEQIALTIAVMALLPVLSLTVGRGGLRALVPTRLPLVLLRGAFGAACAFLGWRAFAMLPLAEAYAFLFATPLFVTLFSALILKEDVGWRRWWATIVGFAGVVVMVNPGFIALETGHLLAALAALCGSLAFIVLRKIGSGETSAAVLFVPNLILILASLPGALGAWRTPDPQALGLMALAGLLMGSGQAGLVFATREAPAAVVAPFQYTQMLWAMLFGLLLFDHVPDVHLLIGLLIVVASGLYTLWRETVRRRPVAFGAVRAAVPAQAARAWAPLEGETENDARAQPWDRGPAG